MSFVLKAAMILLFITNLQARPVFEYKHEFKLKRNEIAKVIITDKETLKKYDFTFSWTLYDFTNIIIHSKYKRWPRQFVLSLRRNLAWATQTLVPNLRIAWEPSRLILSFKGFDLAKKTASFLVLIEDKQNKVNAKFINTKRFAK